jgi:hypothetical protein
LLFDNALNSIGKSKLRHRAAAACTLQLNLNDPVVGNIDKLDVTTVSLQRWPNHIECLLDTFLQIHVSSSLHRNRSYLVSIE